MTQGFYTYDGNEGFFAPNAVYAKDYVLLKEQKDTYTYPVNGWWWFDTLEQAQAHFNTRYDFGLSDTPQATDDNPELDEFLIAYLEGDL
jgi:hypothetical protein